MHCMFSQDALRLTVQFMMLTLIVWDRIAAYAVLCMIIKRANYWDMRVSLIIIITPKQYVYTLPLSRAL